MESNVAPALSVQSFDLVYGNPTTDKQVQDATLQVSPELATLLTRAVAANKDSGGMQLSFDALLIAMVTGGDPLCRWLREHLELRGVPRATIARQRSLQPAELAQSYLEHDGQQRLSQRPRATSSARRALETAESLRSEISGNKPLDVRHLMAAYAVIEGYHDEDFEKLRIDRRAWCLSLAERLASIYPDEARQWANYAQRAPGVPLTAFDSDVGARRNLLDIERDVEAFAMLIASRATSTPLSIGIFGAWGSGKTFFLRQLRARIATLASQARAIEKNPDSRKASPFYGRIAQVEFNAWHYNESNLVASLVEHVFRNLQFADENEIELNRRRDELLAKVAVEQGRVDAVKAEVDTADAQVAARTSEMVAVEAQIKDTEVALKQHEQVAEQARQELANIVAAAPAKEEIPAAAVTARAAVDVVRDAFKDDKKVRGVLRVVEQARVDLNQLRRLAGALMTPSGIALLLGGLAVAFGLPWLLEQFGRVVDDAARRWLDLGGIAVTLTGAWKWVRDHANKLEAGMESVEKERQAEAERLMNELSDVDRAHAERLSQAQKELDQRLAQVRRQQEQLAASHSSLATLRRQLSELGERRAQLAVEKTKSEAERDRIQKEFARVSYGLLLEEFLTDRASTDQYRRLLGLFARVRNDFEKLSGLMVRSNDIWYGHAKPREGEIPQDPTVSRIVLYIDDLDRCSDETVVRVLQVVHLLLAFPLFVCVVAVDPRWMAGCLKKKHPELRFADTAPTDDQKNGQVQQENNDTNADLGERASVSDYLEKIFQIPMWLRSVPEPQRAAFVHALLEPDRGAGTTAADGNIGPADFSIPAVSTRGATATEKAPKIEKLDVKEEEGELVHKLGPLLSTRPRALKRFVNTYRLVKAGLTDVEFARFVRPGPASPHRACMAQLAVLTGHTEIASPFVRAVEAIPSGPQDETLAQWLERTDLEPASIWQPVREAMLTVFEGGSQVKARDFARWIETTQRYAFYVG